MSTTGTEPPRGAAAPQAPAAAHHQQRLGSARDMAGRKREYETIYILRPDSTSDVIAQVNQKVRGVIEAGGGTLLKIDNWGKRKLADEVKKQLKGIYLFFSYLGTAGLVEEEERAFDFEEAMFGGVDEPSRRGKDEVMASEATAEGKSDRGDRDSKKRP